MQTQLGSIKSQFIQLRTTESKQFWQHRDCPLIQVIAPPTLDPWAGWVSLKVGIQRGQNRNGSEYAKALRLLLDHPSPEDRKVTVSIESDRAALFVSPANAILFAAIPMGERRAMLVTIGG
jgi:hypothetical protein